MSIATLDVSPAQSVPLDKIDVSNPDLFVNDTVGDYFARLRKEDPVHYCAESAYGPYWSITKYNDIMVVDTNHKVFSSEAGVGGIIIDDNNVRSEGLPLRSFITMDPPDHDAQRKTVSPIVAPSNLMVLEKTIRERMQNILDRLPVGEEFDWVDNVSIELTTQMLATLFDFPFEERRKLTRWSDVTTAEPGSGIIDSWEQRTKELQECAASFMTLWNERVNEKEPRNDLISMLAHSPATRNMPPEEFLGNILLLIVGGNDTTRNSMSGFVRACNLFPDQFELLRNDPSLVPNAAQEIIRWQSPVTHMRRTTTCETELGGQIIPAGEKIILWYISANRDEKLFPNPDIVDFTRDNARRHIAFGHGVHRCVGARLAEMQLAVLFEEILRRDVRVEQDGPLTYSGSCFLHEIDHMPVKIVPIG